MNNYQNQNWNKNQQNNQDNQAQEQVNSNPPNQSNSQTNPLSGLLMKMAGSCLPLLIEHFMGQPMPASSNSSETQLVLSQVIGLQQQIITNQTALNQRLVQLETNANNQLTNLTQQVQSIKSIRLSHERKQIEFNSQQEQE